MSNQDQQPPVPVSGLAAVLAIVQAVVAVVPRWLVVAAGVVFVSWLGFDLYLNAQMKLTELEKTQGVTTIQNGGTILSTDDMPRKQTGEEAAASEKLAADIVAARKAAKEEYIKRHGGN
jgi:hypothetical protein